MILFSNILGKELAQKISEKSKIKVGKVLLDKFKDGEVRIKIEDNFFGNQHLIRDDEMSRAHRNGRHEKVDQKLEGEEVFVLGCLKLPAENLLEFLLLADAVKRLKPRKLTLIITYFPYARQDRYFEGEPLSSEVLANMINSLKADKVITIDMHSKRVEQMINNLENLSAVEALAKSFVGKEITVIAPDKGGIERAKAFADFLGAEIAYLDKYRPQPNSAEIVDIHGEIKENVIIVDDMIDTGGTIIKSAEFLESKGAKNIYVAVTHGLFSGGLERFENSKIKEVLVTDTLPQLSSKKLKVVSVVDLISNAL